MSSIDLATANISVKLGTNISDVAIPKMTVATTVSHSLGCEIKSAGPTKKKEAAATAYPVIVNLLGPNLSTSFPTTGAHTVDATGRVRKTKPICFSFKRNWLERNGSRVGAKKPHNAHAKMDAITRRKYMKLVRSFSIVLNESACLLQLISE